MRKRLVGKIPLTKKIPKIQRIQKAQTVSAAEIFRYLAGAGRNLLIYSVKYYCGYAF